MNIRFCREIFRLPFQAAHPIKTYSTRSFSKGSVSFTGSCRYTIHLLIRHCLHFIVISFIDCPLLYILHCYILYEAS
ncbi:hypothetical protein MSSAC_4384 [Methanosarcina siciliae C2J]|uniref:Uncharacterized protein n=1 Tax=Methanosarcina siciliae C2J TaxID=1434118 RepID=A0A0E3PTX3_9EURY|nr:hypothetical protein MSSAC_4384 [Methanosarcina siciliae C2J]